jgi:hypothetical protein
VSGLNVRYRFFVDCLDDAFLSGLLAVFCDVDHILAALGIAIPGRFMHPLWFGLSGVAGLYLVGRGLLEMVADE